MDDRRPRGQSDLRRRPEAAGRSFPAGEALVPDGVAGEETLVRLVATAPGANGPR
jgi:hypothetical protein